MHFFKVHALLHTMLNYVSFLDLGTISVENCLSFYCFVGCAPYRGPRIAGFFSRLNDIQMACAFVRLFFFALFTFLVFSLKTFFINMSCDNLANKTSLFFEGEGNEGFALVYEERTKI